MRTVPCRMQGVHGTATKQGRARRLRTCDCMSDTRLRAHACKAAQRAMRESSCTDRRAPAGAQAHALGQDLLRGAAFALVRRPWAAAGHPHPNLDQLLAAQQGLQEREGLRPALCGGAYGAGAPRAHREDEYLVRRGDLQDRAAACGDAACGG